MEGVFLAARIQELARRIEAGKCTAVGEPFRGGMGLVFHDGMVVLSARPDAPDLWWQRSAAIGPLPSPVWAHHLEGGTVTWVSQLNCDRVLRIGFSSGLMFGAEGVELVFEATGRNSNIILVRQGDRRILGCLRRVTSSRCRYRSIVPGQVYVQPPPSGLHPGQWGTSEELRTALARDNLSAGDIYPLLEGVGPVTAGAILDQAGPDERSVLDIVLELEIALLKRSFSPWMGPRGPLPVELGPGEPIEDVLAPSEAGTTASGAILEERLAEWLTMLEGRAAGLRKRLAHLASAREKLVPEETLRLWAGLLLTHPSRERGVGSATLEDWEGNLHVIPLRSSRTRVENAERYFRKASNARVEDSNLAELTEASQALLDKVMKAIEEAPRLSLEELDGLIRESPKTEKRKRTERRTPEPVILTDGWRCFVGRNATDNDRVTFSLGRRGDIWLHARGIPGAHVLLKLDGRMDNPPERIMIEAAVLAARGSGRSSGVIPVDHTPVQYVRRMKKGKPGQVFYTREKTIFVDLDRLGRTRGTSNQVRRRGLQ